MAEYRGNTRPGRLDAADFFEDSDRAGYYRTQVQGSMAMQPQIEEPARRENPYRKERLERERQRSGRSHSSRSGSERQNAERARSEAQRESRQRSEAQRESRQQSRQKQTGRTLDMAQLKGRFHFFLCAGLIMVGCMMVVIMYIRIFSKTNEIAELRSQLTEIESANKAQIATAENMNMDALYAYATEALGMVDATAETTIWIKVVSQSYTTSNLPVQEIPDSKVTFHWFD